MAEGRYLLVVSITHGQQFPARNGKEIVIHGKFNDELLTSDPVPHDSTPQINTGMIISDNIQRVVSIPPFSISAH